MNDAVSLLPPRGPAESTLLAMIAISGELPVSQAARLIDSAYYLEKMITRLKKEKLIHTYYSDGLRGYRLTAKAKKRLLMEHAEQFTHILDGETAINKPKYSIPDRLRLHRMAEVLVSMLNADIIIYPWTKPALFERGHTSGAVTFTLPTYYTAGEIKEIGQEAAKIRASRATGVLLTPTDTFVTYNTGNTEMKWQYQAEVRLKTLLNRELNQARLNNHKPGVKIQAIVFAADMEQMLVLADTVKQHKHQYFVLDGSYQHFYYVPNNGNGEFLLQLLCDKGLKTSLDELLTNGLRPRDPKANIENDGYDGNGVPVLLGYTCDLPRIKRFINALEIRDAPGSIICFDFQAEILRQICVKSIELQPIDLEALKGGIVNQ